MGAARGGTGPAPAERPTGFPRSRGPALSIDDQLSHILYQELRVEARKLLAGEWHWDRPSITSLVHQAIQRVGSSQGRPLGDRGYLRAASRAMWCILVDRARKRKRPGNPQPLRERDLVAPAWSAGLVLGLDEALQELTQSLDEEAVDLVRLRLVAGLNGKQAAEELNISPATESRMWNRVRAFIKHRLAERNHDA